MSLIHRTDEVSVLSDSRGFVEIVFQEHRSLTTETFLAIFQRLVASGYPEVSLLISRLNEYGVFSDFNSVDFHRVNDLEVKRIAYFAPSPGDQAFSNLMRITAFRNVPCRVFDDRERAIAWLRDGKA